MAKAGIVTGMEAAPGLSALPEDLPMLLDTATAARIGGYSDNRNRWVIGTPSLLAYR